MSEATLLKCVLSWYVGGWVIHMDVSSDDFACAKDDDCPRQQQVRDEIMERYLAQCLIEYESVPPAVWTRNRNCPFTIVADKRVKRLYQPPPANKDRLIVSLSWYGDWVVRLNIQTALYQQATDSTNIPARDLARGRIMAAYRGRCEKDYESVPPAWWSDDPNSHFTIVPVARPRPARKTSKK